MGEADRRFAVVASEVRALAQRSADAAKEIKALISTSSTQVASGVELVDGAGRALGRITQVDEINGIVGEIAASAQEQATAVQQVNTAVNRMDQMQNAAVVEETTAASQSLTSEAEQMAELIGHFRLSGGKAHSVASTHSSGRGASRQKPATRSKISPSTAARTSGNLALKAQLT